MMSLLNKLPFKIKANFSVFFVMTTVVVIFNLSLTIGMFIFYQVKANDLKVDAINHQQSHAKEIAGQIEHYIIRAQQLSDSAVSLLSDVRQDHKIIEDTLFKLLQSATDDSIHGLGVWFEPYIFDADQRYVGPYVHKTNVPNKPIILTHEWADIEYNYFSKAWYQQGKLMPYRKVFNEPFYEKGSVWMTLTQGFLDNNNRFAGVVTIDITLQTLLNLLEVNKAKLSGDIYITTQQDTLFVHPEIDKILPFVKKRHQVNSILDVSLQDLREFEKTHHKSDQITSTVIINKINWQVHIATERDVLYKDVYTLRNSIITNVFFIWLAVLFILLLLTYFGRQAKKARLAQEKLEQALIEQRGREATLKELNSLLETKVAERTEALHQANAEITALNDRLKSENLRMSSELEITRRLQKLILPKPEELTAITDLDIAGFMEPATEVGGDYYDVLKQDQHVKIAIGDVTGHGLESGMLMLMVQMAVRILFNHQVSDSNAFFNVLNSTLYDNINRMNSDKNLTLLVLDYCQGKVRLSGQHETVLWVRANGKVELIDTLDLGFMVGIVADISDFVSHQEFHLEEGEGLVLYTDGITEARNAENDLYGLERLCQVVSQHWAQSAAKIQQAVIDDVYLHIHNCKQLDDITLVVLKR